MTVTLHVSVSMWVYNVIVLSFKSECRQQALLALWHFGPVTASPFSKYSLLLKWIYPRE